MRKLRHGEVVGAQTLTVRYNLKPCHSMHCVLPVILYIPRSLTKCKLPFKEPEINRMSQYHFYMYNFFLSGSALGTPQVRDLKEMCEHILPFLSLQLVPPAHIHFCKRVIDAKSGRH